MATRWKSKKVLLTAIVLMSFGITMLTTFLLSGQDKIKGSYYDTNGFQNTMYHFLDYVVLFDIAEVDQEELKSRIIVSEEDINQHRYHYGDLETQINDIKNQYANQIAELQSMNNTDAATALIEERDAKIQDITLNFTSDEHVRKKVLAEKSLLVDEMIANIEGKRETWADYSKMFSYYLKDTTTGKVYTSLTDKEAESYKAYFSKDKMPYVKTYTSHDSLSLDSDIADSYLFNNQGVNFTSVGNDSSYTGYIGVVDADGEIAAAAKQYETYQLYYIVGCVLGVIGLLYSLLVIVKGRVFTENNAMQSRAYNRIPFDIRIIIVMATALACGAALINALSTQYMTNGDSGYSQYDWSYFAWNATLSIIVISVSAILFVFFLNSLVGRTFAEQVRTAILYKVYDAMRSGFLYLHVGTQLVILLAVVFLGGMLFARASFQGDAILFLMFATPVGLFILYILFKYAGYFNQIAKTVSGIAAGENAEDLHIPGKSLFAKLGSNVNELKQGFKLSQHEQVKSERLKTELITNVSHDLRTPLTSIITYTDLLKSEGITEEERQNYVEIIDRKSKRLKVLIEDLFEASKMATGNIELVKTEVEIVQLLQQALAEYDEKIEASQLQFRVTHDDPPIYAVVDGQKLWRVFDNLIGNILKYSLPNTRVYIDVKNRKEAVEISFKNVSQYELGGNVDELFERFKRGDQSRQTEGSGLGLAIAKSIIDLHEGEMDIDVDGDLFKVNIKLRK